MDAKTTRKEAEVVATQIKALFQRERLTRQLTKQLIDYVKHLARTDIANPGRPDLSDLERIATAQVMSVVDEIPPVTVADFWKSGAAADLNPSSLETKRQHFGKFSDWTGEMVLRKLRSANCIKFLDSLGVFAWRNAGCRFAPTESADLLGVLILFATMVLLCILARWIGAMD